MEPSTAVTLPVLVQIEGRDFVWTPEEGLDAEAVMTVDRFIWWKAHTLRRTAAQAGLSMDDLAQEGRLGALRAAKRFIPNDNNNFLSFACYHIMQRMHDALGLRDVYVPLRHRKAHRKNGTFPAVASIEAFPPEGRTFKAEALPDAAENCEERDLVRFALEQLPERDRLVLQMVFGIGMEEQTLAKVGEELGVTRQRAMQLKHRAMLRLRLVLGAKGIQ
jgi:RNA polymerase sigma factor (sigma-70 family)